MFGWDFVVFCFVAAFALIFGMTGDDDGSDTDIPPPKTNRENI